LDTLTFEVTTINVAMDPTGFKLVNQLNPAMSVLASTVEVTTFGYRVTFTGLATGVVDAVIGSGETETFVLKANVIDPNTAAGSGGSSILRTSLRISDEFFSRFDEDFGSSNLIRGTDLLDDIIEGTIFHG